MDNDLTHNVYMVRATWVARQQQPLADLHFRCRAVSLPCSTKMHTSSTVDWCMIDVCRLRRRSSASRNANASWKGLLLQRKVPLLYVPHSTTTTSCGWAEGWWMIRLVMWCDDDVGSAFGGGTWRRPTPRSRICSRRRCGTCCRTQPATPTSLSKWYAAGGACVALALCDARACTRVALVLLCLCLAVPLPCLVSTG